MGRRIATSYEPSLQSRAAFLCVRRNADPEDSFRLAPPKGKQPVRSAAAEGFAEVEVVAVLRPLFFLPLDDLCGDGGCPPETLPDDIPCLFILVNPLCDNVSRPLQGIFRRRDFTPDEGHSTAFGIRLVLSHQYLGQRLQALAPGKFGPRHPLGFEREVEVFEGGTVPRRFDARAEFLGQFPLLSDGRQDSLFASRKLAEAVHLLLDGGYLHLVQSAGALLAVAADKRDSRAFLQQGDSTSDLPFRELQGLGDE